MCAVRKATAVEITFTIYDPHQNRQASHHHSCKRKQHSEHDISARPREYILPSSHCVSFSNKRNFVHFWWLRGVKRNGVNLGLCQCTCCKFFVSIHVVRSGGWDAVHFLAQVRTSETYAAVAYLEAIHKHGVRDFDVDYIHLQIIVDAHELRHSNNSDRF